MRWTVALLGLLACGPGAAGEIIVWGSDAILPGPEGGNVAWVTLQNNGTSDEVVQVRNLPSPYFRFIPGTEPSLPKMGFPPETLVPAGAAVIIPVTIKPSPHDSRGWLDFGHAGVREMRARDPGWMDVTPIHPVIYLQGYGFEPWCTGCPSGGWSPVPGSRDSIPSQQNGTFLWRFPALGTATPFLLDRGTIHVRLEFAEAVSSAQVEVELHGGAGQGGLLARGTARFQEDDPVLNLRLDVPEPAMAFAPRLLEVVVRLVPAAEAFPLPAPPEPLPSTEDQTPRLREGSWLRLPIAGPDAETALHWGAGVVVGPVRGATLSSCGGTQEIEVPVLALTAGHASFNGSVEAPDGIRARLVPAILQAAQVQHMVLFADVEPEVPPGFVGNLTVRVVQEGASHAWDQNTFPLTVDPCVEEAGGGAFGLAALGTMVVVTLRRRTRPRSRAGNHPKG